MCWSYTRERQINLIDRHIQWTYTASFNKLGKRALSGVIQNLIMYQSGLYFYLYLKMEYAPHKQSLANSNDKVTDKKNINSFGLRKADNICIMTSFFCKSSQYHH